MLLHWIFCPGDALDFPTWEGTIEPGRPLVCVTSEDGGVWFVGRPDPGSVSTCTYNADDVLSETFADPAAAKLAAEKWAATHVPEVAEALLREAMMGMGELLADTQHAAHADCADGPCPVRKVRELHARLASLLGDAP